MTFIRLATIPDGPDPLIVSIAALQILCADMLSNFTGCISSEFYGAMA